MAPRELKTPKALVDGSAARPVSDRRDASAGVWQGGGDDPMSSCPHAATMSIRGGHAA